MLDPLRLFARDFSIIKMNSIRPVDLIILMTLPGNQNEIAGPGRLQGDANRLSSIRFDPITAVGFEFGNAKLGSWNPQLGKTGLPDADLDLA
jgi:hypothetical protein